eukprot:1161446-Pelagomonas_calceolata.AAC.13
MKTTNISLRGVRPPLSRQAEKEDKSSNGKDIKMKAAAEKLELRTFNSKQIQAQSARQGKGYKGLAYSTKLWLIGQPRKAQPSSELLN